VVLIDEPATLNTASFGQFPPPQLNGVGGSGLDYKNGGTPNVFQGQASSTDATAIRFVGIPIDPPGSNATRVLTISNLRANVSALAAGAITGTTPLTALITIQGPSVNQNFSPNVGFVAAGLTPSPNGFAAVNPDNTKPLQPIPAKNFNQNLSAALVNFNLDFVEFIPGVFKTQLQEAGTFGSSALGVGAASQGTQLSVTFTNVPVGLFIFVTMTDVTIRAGQQPVPPSTPRAILASSDPVAPPSGTPDGQTQTGIPLKQLAITGGAASATWTCVTFDPGMIVTLSFGVVLAGSNQTGGPSTIPVAGTLAPQSVDMKPEPLSKAPVPRFAADTQTTNFVITL
jgi:hypothetical protein